MVFNEFCLGGNQTPRNSRNGVDSKAPKYAKCAETSL